MKGYLLVFNTETNKESVKLNHKLMGRIMSVPRKGTIVRYYRKGALDSVPHKRLISGCYFSSGDIGFDDPKLLKMKVDLQQIYDADLKTARGYWVSHARKNGMEVRNL